MNIFAGYAIEPNSYCYPYQAKPMIETYDLGDAKKKCSANPNCHMFFHQRDTPTMFWLCGKTATIHHSSENPMLLNPILYIQGNKPLRQY